MECACVNKETCFELERFGLASQRINKAQVIMSVGERGIETEEL